MILQTDKLLNSMSGITFDKSGCALFCLTEVAIRKGFYTFERHQFVKDCERWETKGIIDNEAFVLDWNRLCEALNLPYEIVIESTHKLQRPPMNGEFQILHILNPYTNYMHFCNADNRDNVTYDPLGESDTAKMFYARKGSLLSRRIFKRVKA
jgi:hypothetical protein